MGTEEKDNRLVIDYIDGELNDSEVKSFKERLLIDSDFKELYEDQKAFVEGIKQAESLNTLDFLKSLEKDTPMINQTDKGKVIPLKLNRKIWWAAASITLLMCLYFVWPSQSVNTEDMYSQYYEPYPNFSPVVKRGPDEKAVLSIYENAMVLYEAGNYIEAQSILKDLFEKTNEVESGFYLAQCYMYNGKHKEALKVLKYLLEKPTDLESPLCWYKALTLIKLDRLEDATDELNKLIKEKSIYKEKAQEIIKTIQ